MWMLSFILNMALRKFNFIFIFLTIGYIQLVKSQCSSPFSNGDVTSFCYYSESTSLSWSDSYDQCLSQTTNGILIEIFSLEQFTALKNIKINGKDSFWLGANNFGSFRDSEWHWLDGSIVDKSVITWCPTSTYETAIGTYCAAYDSHLQCVTNYLCSTLLPAPCVSIPKQAKTSLNARTISTGTCTNSYGGAYANWWTYSILLLNWFILFCFILYLFNCLNLNKRTVILTISLLILSFILIIIFAILWGVQYQDIIRIPLVLVIIGCLASVLFLIDILILVSNRTNIQRWMACMIATIVTIILECFLMLGLILCIAYCSAYISLASTNLDKDVIAALLAAIIAAISIVFYNGILYLIGHTGQDRIHAMRSNDRDGTNLTTTQTVLPHRSQHTTARNQRIERATSPVDERILNEFYADRPKDMHQYQLDGRQYVVYEGKTFSDIDPYKKDLTEAMLLQEPQGLRDAIARVKYSVHATALTEEIRQAEGLLARLK